MTIESEQEEIQSQGEALTLTQERKAPALTLVVQSWATPIVGVILLVAGLLGGYYVRPLFSPDTTPVAFEGNPATGVESGSITIPTPDADRAAQQQELMNAVVEQTRHFRGDPDAPVTIIEFSDFQ